MDEINKIRKAFFTDGETKNAIALKFNRSWDTIHRIVSMERNQFQNRGVRPNRKPRVMTPDVLNAIQAYLDEEVSKNVKKKQRYTAQVIYNEIRAKGIYHGSIRRLQETVKRLREENNQSKKPSFLPLDFILGSTLQVDHGEVDIIVNGHRFTGYLFIASVPGYALRYCQVFPTKSREAWGEFHERMFLFFGGVFNKIVYDNDSVLVKKVMGRERSQTTFSLSLEEHFQFASYFCNVASGNEKGAVENGVGYCRRNFLPGCPSFASWEKANKHLSNSCKQDISNRKHYKTEKPLQGIFDALKQKLAPLPLQKAWYKWVDSRVDSCQLVNVDHCKYSVPEKYVGTSIRAALSVFQVSIYKDDELIAKHERRYTDSDSLVLDHYLDQLKYKTSAFWDCKAVTNHKFEQPFLDMWERLADKFPKREATGHFVKILLLGRVYSKNNLIKAIEQSLRYGALDHAAVENLVRQLDVNQSPCSEEELANSLSSIDIRTWGFDVAPYAELCKGARV